MKRYLAVAAVTALSTAAACFGFTAATGHTSPAGHDPRTTAKASGKSGDVTIRPGQTAVFQAYGEWLGCQYRGREVSCFYPDGTPTMTTSTGRGRIRGMVIYLAAGGTVNVKSVHVPANKTYAGTGPEDDTVWTFR